MKWNLILFATGSIFVSSCLKTARPAAASVEEEFINKAHTYFIDSVSTRQGTPANYTGGSARSIVWDQAKVYTTASGLILLAPVRYKDPLYIKTEFSGNKLFSLSDLTRVLMYVGPDKRLHCEMLTNYPDSNYLKDPSGPFTGYLSVDDWWGNSIDKYLYEKGSVKKLQVSATQASMVIRYCNVIYGYNYASGAPDVGYSWIQYGACYSLYIPDRSSDFHGSIGGGGFGAGGAGGFGAGVTVAFAPPDNPIANIVDYLKCFTNVGGNDHTYTVTVCVEQPVPNTRATWEIVSGGPAGSSNAGNVVDVGHTFLIFTEQYGSTTITRNIGFYPSRNVNPVSASAQGWLNNNEKSPYNISATFTVTNAAFTTMLNSVARGNDPGFNYNLNSENCTTFALQTLASGGIFLPSTIGSWPGGMGNNPGDLGEDLRQMNLLPNMTRSTVSNFHPNIGNCQ
jgi:hypothetical protein